MRVVFHPEAEHEFQKAIDYYESLQPGLGFDFSNEVRMTVQHITLMPNAWTVLCDGVRRCLVSRFPYGVLYVKEDSSLLILAVMNLHREPSYWQHRSL